MPKSTSRPTDACQACDGEGYVLPHPFASRRVDCTVCGCTGRVEAYRCELCGASTLAAIVEIDQGGVPVCASCLAGECSCVICEPPAPRARVRDTIPCGQVHA